MPGPGFAPPLDEVVPVAFARTWVLFAWRGAIALLFGLAALMLPMNLVILVISFGIYALLDGMATLAVGSRHLASDHAWLVLMEGIAGVGVALAIFVSIRMAPGVLRGLIAWWAIGTGVLEFMVAGKLWGELSGAPLFAVAGAASAALGFAIFFWPSTDAHALVAFLGCYAVVFGIAMLAHALRIRGSLREVHASHRPPGPKPGAA